MKRTLTLFALMAICSAMMVSCKNKQSEPTPEEIQAQKVTLADSVLTEIDSLTVQFLDASSKGFNTKSFTLTEAEKMVKPDYLLDPSVANSLVTKSQKVNALAIYVVELNIRKMYDMPCEEAQETIAKLAADINHPIDPEFMTSEASSSEKIKREYEICKERGDLAYFWQFQNTVIAETAYILAHNPEFLNKITEEQWQAYCVRMLSRLKVIEKLAKYDEDMAKIWEFRNKNRVTASDEERDRKNQSKESAQQYYNSHKDKFIAKRNALLQ